MSKNSTQATVVKDQGTPKPTAEASLSAIEAAVSSVAETTVPTDPVEVVDTSRYETTATETRALVSVKTEVGNELTDEYMSLSAVFSHLRRRPKHVQAVLDEASAKRHINGRVVHDMVNVGSISTMAFFMTESEAERRRFSIKQALNILLRASKTTLRLDQVKELREKYTYWHRVPAEVQAAYKGK